MLPMRATAPPMIDESTRVSISTLRPVARLRSSVSAATRSAGQRDRGDDLGPHHVLVVHEAVDERLRHIRHDRQAIPVGEHEEQLGDRRLQRAGASDQLFHDGALPGRGDRGVGEHAVQPVVSRQELSETAELAFGLGEIFALARGHVKEGSRVANGRAATRHRTSRVERAPAGWQTCAAGCWIIVDDIETRGKP